MCQSRDNNAVSEPERETRCLMGKLRNMTAWVKLGLGLKCNESGEVKKSGIHQRAPPKSQISSMAMENEKGVAELRGHG